MREAVHFWVTGRVQGVYFRAHTKSRAEELQLTGWVRNLADGQVEGVACGENAAVQTFTEWLATGPERAHVTHLEVQPEAVADWSAFDIL